MRIPNTTAKRTGPIRVLYVDHCSELSGAEIGLLHLLRGFTEIEPVVLLAGSGPLVGALEAEGIRVEIEPLPDAVRSYRRSVESRRRGVRLAPAVLVGLAGYSRAVARRVREVGPDIVHTNSAKAHLYGGLAGRFEGLPVVWHLREPMTAENIGPLASLAMRIGSVTMPAALIANSPSTAQSAGWFRGRVRVVPSPIDVQRFARAALTPPPKGRRVGIVGTLTRQKGQDIFLRAFAEAFASARYVSAVVCGGNLFGDHAYERNLRKLAEELGIADRVVFTGFVSDVERVLAGLDVLVSASVRPEGFGQTIFQALAAGVPVVATNNGGACDFLHHGDSALLVPPGDAPRLASAMRRALDEGQLRERLRTAGVALVQRFSPERVQAQTLDLYEEIIAQGRGRRLRRRPRADRKREPDGADRTASSAHRGVPELANV
jgi:glycosyltransferase involved in cell wall biosynthesis